jgi:hypothetical protein
MAAQVFTVQYMNQLQTFFLYLCIVNEHTLPSVSVVLSLDAGFEMIGKFEFSVCTVICHHM